VLKVSIEKKEKIKKEVLPFTWSLARKRQKSFKSIGPNQI